MAATCGRRRASASASPASALPWWATLSAVTGSRSSEPKTSLSASAGRKAVKEPSTSRATIARRLGSWPTWRSAGSACGHSTSSSIGPARTRWPASGATVRTPRRVAAAPRGRGPGGAAARGAAGGRGRGGAGGRAGGGGGRGGRRVREPLEVGERKGGQRVDRHGERRRDLPQGGGDHPQPHDRRDSGRGEQV